MIFTCCKKGNGNHYSTTQNAMYRFSRLISFRNEIALSPHRLWVRQQWENTHRRLDKQRPYTIKIYSQVNHVQKKILVLGFLFDTSVSPLFIHELDPFLTGIILFFQDATVFCQTKSSGCAARASTPSIWIAKDVAIINKEVGLSIVSIEFV